MRLGLYPNLGVAWYWACLVGEGRPLVTVIDHEVALPKAPSLEIRADGLWADHIVETPFDHMTLGCEAFAVAVDDPAEVYGDLRGDRVPVRLRPRVGDRPRRAVPVDRHHPLRGVVQRARRDPRRRRDDRVRRHRPARPQLGRARLVEPRLGVDRRRPRGRHPLPHRSDPCARHGGVRPGLRAAARRRRGADRRVHGQRGARRARVPHHRRDHLRPARDGRGAALLQPGAPRRRGTRRHPPRPVPAGAVPLRDRRRPLRASAGRSGTNRSTETVSPIPSPGGHPPSTSVGEAATLGERTPSFSLLRGSDAPPPRTLVDVLHATAADPPRRARARRRHGALLRARSLARGRRPRRPARARRRRRGRPGRRPHDVGHATTLYVAILAVLRAGAAYVPVDADDPAGAGRPGVRRGGRGASCSPTAPTLDEPDASACDLSGPDARRRRLDHLHVRLDRGAQGRRRHPPVGGRVRRRRGRAVRAAPSRSGPSDRVLAGLSVAFDASCEEMWLAWRHGACLVPGPARARAHRAWTSGRGWSAQGITVVSTVPTLAGLWPADCARPGAAPHLRRRGLPAEPGRAGRRRRAARCGTPTDRPRRPSSPAPRRWRPTGPVRIGLPLAGWDLAVVDPDGVPVPAGEIGELIIGGVGLARYLDPDKDAERFAADAHARLGPRLPQRRPRGARPGGPRVRRAGRRAGEARRPPHRARRGRRRPAGAARRVGGGRRGADDRRRQPGARRLPRAGGRRVARPAGGQRRAARDAPRRARARARRRRRSAHPHLGQGRPARAALAAARDGLDGRRSPSAHRRSPGSPQRWTEVLGAPVDGRRRRLLRARRRQPVGRAARVRPAHPLPAGHRRRRVRLPAAWAPMAEHIAAHARRSSQPEDRPWVRRTPRPDPGPPGAAHPRAPDGRRACGGWSGSLTLNGLLGLVRRRTPWAPTVSWWVVGAGWLVLVSPLGRMAPGGRRRPPAPARRRPGPLPAGRPACTCASGRPSSSPTPPARPTSPARRGSRTTPAPSARRSARASTCTRCRRSPGCSRSATARRSSPRSTWPATGSTATSCIVGRVHVGAGATVGVAEHAAPRRAHRPRRRGRRRLGGRRRRVPRGERWSGSPADAAGQGQGAAGPTSARRAGRRWVVAYGVGLGGDVVPARSSRRSPASLVLGARRARHRRRSATPPSRALLAVPARHRGRVRHARAAHARRRAAARHRRSARAPSRCAAASAGRCGRPSGCSTRPARCSSRCTPACSRRCGCGPSAPTVGKRRRGVDRAAAARR